MARIGVGFSGGLPHLLSTAGDEDPVTLRTGLRCNEAFALEPHPSLHQCPAYRLILLRRIASEIAGQRNVVAIEQPALVVRQGVQILQDDTCQIFGLQRQRAVLPEPLRVRHRTPRTPHHGRCS